MSRGPMRRAQLVAPFGTGAITVVPDGTALIAAGLDHWFERDDPDADSEIDATEYEIHEWRLSEVLRVSHFRLPPDYRTNRFGEKDLKNLRLTVPFLRFPRWNFCRRCKLLHQLPLSYRERPRCPECTTNQKKGPILAQVPFVAMCEYGHLQDFPWNEWVHSSLSPPTNHTLRLRSTGGASLASQTVECSCGAKRTLAQITEAAPGSSTENPETFLSKNLARGTEYLCQGSEPWNGSDERGECSLHVRGSLRAAANVYFALVKSSIFLPQGGGDVPEQLLEILSEPPLSVAIHAARNVGVEPTVEQVRSMQHGHLLKPFSDGQVENGLEVSRAVAVVAPNPDEDGADIEDETEFRRPEFHALRQEQDTPELRVDPQPLGLYGPEIARWFSGVSLIHTLRETRALWGFSRIYPDAGNGLRDRKRLLWRDPPDWQHSWLPAYVVHGEGILLEVNSDALDNWEKRSDVVQRVDQMVARYESVQQARRLKRREITPRFVLLHTLAHLIMNQLTFDCGYSSAALRERLYVSSGAGSMSAILIYTAAGDAEGTMGGLVRMGKPGYLEPALTSALVSAEWCSADPVCMELGQSGQGPDSCNLAACHSCGLVPETACEEFNRFLDRGLVIGWPESGGMAPGFFAS
jgi:hypothetical protein